LTFSRTFGVGTLTIRDAGDVVEATQAGWPWTSETVARLLGGHNC
jgi:hypothetical protein